MEYVKRKVVLESLKISYQTLYKMAERNEIDSIKVGENTLYNLDKYLREKGIKGGEQEKIAYCRVSSNNQKEDLKRQIAYMKDKFPTHRIISDIGSGLNFNRNGLNEIIEKAIAGKVEELVVAYKDRLARFGYEFVENLITKYSKGKIIIINKKEEETPTEELTKDIVTIMNVYTAKINGLRKYKSQLKDEINKK
jgi:predicted site-specific integrase-resolvase